MWTRPPPPREAYLHLFFLLVHVFTLQALLVRAQFGLKLLNVWFLPFATMVAIVMSLLVFLSNWQPETCLLPSMKGGCFWTTWGIIKMKTDWQTMYLGRIWKKRKQSFWSLTSQFFSFLFVSSNLCYFCTFGICYKLCWSLTEKPFVSKASSFIKSQWRCDNTSLLNTTSCNTILAWAACLGSANLFPFHWKIRNAKEIIASLTQNTKRMLVSSFCDDCAF